MLARAVAVAHEERIYIQFKKHVKIFVFIHSQLDIRTIGKERFKMEHSRFKVMLTDEELGLPAIDDLCNKFYDFLKATKETAPSGRKTRSVAKTTNRRADQLFEEIMAFKLPPTRLRPTSPISHQATATASSLSTDRDSQGSSVSSNNEPQACTRTSPPGCGTPSVSRKPQAIQPSTPTQQNIRAHMKKNIDSGSSNVLTAALNQKHPSVSVTKIRQLLRAESAQKKREEEGERQERLRVDRKAKEERAEAQKKQLLVERAITAKQKREQRLLHAAEVRKARQQQKISEEQKMRDEQKFVEEQKAAKEQVKKLDTQQNNNLNQQKQQQKAPQAEPQEKNHKLDETYNDQQNNIDISVHDETTDTQKTQVPQVATWAKAPHLRDAVINQFSKGERELLKIARSIFQEVELPVDLQKIFGGKSVNNKLLCRTSSAVWSPQNRPMKRSSSMVMTPTDPKRPV